MLKVGPLLLIATICHSITHRYTFAMWLVRRRANYCLHHPPQASVLSPHLPALSQGRKAFSQCNSCLRRARIRTIPLALHSQASENTNDKTTFPVITK